jgi:hypothetical protein
LSPGSRVPVLCVFCPLSLVLGRMFRLLDYGSTLSGVTASGQGATGPPGCPWGHPAHAVAPVALEQYLMGGLCRAMGPCRLSRPPDPGKPWQWQVTPLIHGRCCGGPPQPENAVGRGPPNQWVPAGVGQLGGSQLSVVERGHAEVRMGVRDAVPRASGSAPPKGGTRLALGCRRQTPPWGGVIAL